MRNPKIVFINYCLPIIGVIFLAGMAYAGWTPPPTGSTPPANNIKPPITSGSAAAYKAGAFGGGGLFETDVDTHLGLLAGKVGIGTSNPTEKLQIAGKALADDFCLNSDPAKCLSTVSAAGSGGATGLPLRQGPAGCNFIVTTSAYCYTLGCEGCSGRGCTSQYLNCDGTCGSKNNRPPYFTCPTKELSGTGGGSGSPGSNAGSQLFFSSGTFTAPAGVTSVTVELWGGGGGGGGGGGAVGDLAQMLNFVGPNIGGGGGGGGSGGHKKSTVSVTPGSNYTVTVGAGGSGGAGGASISSFTSTDFVCGNNGSSGSNGGSSNVAGLVAVSGGSGGQGGHPACRDKEGIGGKGADGGNGGTAGEGGSNGTVGSRWDGGGGGGFGVFGQGGSGRSGGIGAYMNGGTTGAPGDGGNDGFVIITW